MQQLPKEFIGRMVRTVLFIGLVAACCAGVATFGMLVASKFNLTTSRNQVPLTSVKIEGGKVLIPENGKTTREAGWTLRNSRGQYILTLDEMEAGSLDTAEPVIEVEGGSDPSAEKRYSKPPGKPGTCDQKRYRYTDHQGRRKPGTGICQRQCCLQRLERGESWMQTILLQSGWRAETLPLQAQSLAL